MKHKLIVFEGIDGVGKTTMCRSVQSRLMALGIPAIVYEDVEEKTIGFNVLKPFIVGSASKEASLYFYLASAVHKSDTIKKLLQTSWVICDRYVYSTLARHYARGMLASLIPSIQELPILQPDYFFLLTVSDAVRRERIVRRGNATVADLAVSRPGTEPYAMESMLRSFQPIILENHFASSESCADAVCQHLFSSESPRALQ